MQTYPETSAECLEQLGYQVAAAAHEAWIAGTERVIAKLQVGETFTVRHAGRAYEARVTRVYRTSRQEWAVCEFRTRQGKKLHTYRTHRAYWVFQPKADSDVYGGPR